MFLLTNVSETNTFVGFFLGTTFFFVESVGVCVVGLFNESLKIFVAIAFSASPLALISLLKAISYGWTQVELEIEAKEILEKAKAIYENLCNSSGHLQELGKSLHKAIESYNSFVGSVERNVFSKGRELFKLNPSKEIAETKEASEIPRELKSPDWKREDRSE